MILRRVQLADGRTRAFVNDQPVSVQVLKALGAALVEIHGQHDDRALVDATTHRRLLDAYGGLERDAAAVSCAWTDWRAARGAVDTHRARVEAAQREAEWLRHAADELTRLKPEGGEETTLAERRTAMMQGEKVAADLREAQDVLAGGHSAIPTLAATLRRLERRAAQAPQLIEPSVKALDQALTALDEVRAHLDAALRAADHDPHELERIEERLFALRAAGRKYNAPVDGLAALAARYAEDLAALNAGAEQLAGLEARAREAEVLYRAGAKALSAARTRAAQKLDKAVNGELKPLRLERAKFSTAIESEAGEGGPDGIDRVEFWVQTNPGTRPAGLRRGRYRGRRRGGRRDRRAPCPPRPPRPGDGGDARPPGRRPRRPAFADYQGRTRQGQARGDPSGRGGRRQAPRGDRPHARRRRDHRGGARRGGAVDQGGRVRLTLRR